METFEKRKPFTAEIIDNLLNFANEKCRLNFDESDIPKANYVAEDCVIMVFEKETGITWSQKKMKKWKS